MRTLITLQCILLVFCVFNVIMALGSPARSMTASSDEPAIQSTFTSEQPFQVDPAIEAAAAAASTSTFAPAEDDQGADHDLNNVERDYVFKSSYLNEIDTSKIKTVLVLGAGGLIGRNLVNMLKARGFEVLEVKNRRHIDLRVPKALDQFEYDN